MNLYQRMAKQLGIEAEPDLYTTPGWLKLHHDRVSTSNGSLEFVELFNFAPVVADGFGIGYIIKDDKLTFNVTSFAEMGDKLQQFVAHINDSLLEMAEVLHGLVQNQKNCKL